MTIATLATLMSSGPLAAGSTPSVEKASLENGLVLRVIPQPHLPMVVLSAVVDAGSRYDPKGKEGLASLTADLLTEGAGKRSAEELHDAVDFLGAQLSAGASDDYATISLTVLKKDLALGMDLFADVLLRPRFEEDEFQRKQEESVADIESDGQDPGATAGRAFRKALFGEGPYRSPASGEKEAVASLSVAEVKSFYGATWRPESAILVASGEITMEELEPLATKLLGGWKGTGKKRDLLPAAVASKPSIVRIERELSQANVLWGHVGTTRDDPDWYALQVMNYILGGGGFSSRMMASIRTEAGLAYSVHSYFIPAKTQGSFQVGLQTKSSSTGDAIERVVKEIERIRTTEVTEEELDSAKKFLTGSFPMRFDSNAEMVGFYGQVEFYGLGLDYPARYPDLINSVTQEEVQRVAQKYLVPAKSIVVVVGKQSEIELDEPESGASDS